MTRWYSEKKREHFYKEAKKVGYRARSAFKLKQIQKKFKIIKPGNTVIDLGAAPGSWSQVAKEFVGDNGLVIGIDVSPIDRLDGVTFIEGDLTQQQTVEKINSILGGKKADVVLSDMSPNISGNYSVDHARSIFLSEQALFLSDFLLKKEGSFVCKVFDGEEFQSFFYKVKNKYRNVKIFSPKASRQSSSEVYVIARFRQTS